jgi:protein involved in temperature-dependent protein secretion
MVDAFLAALSHPAPSARLLANYSDFAWNLLDDRALGVEMIRQAIRAAPGEPAYRITLVRMLAAQGDRPAAQAALHQLAALNIGGQLDSDLVQLRTLPALQEAREVR